MIVKQFQVIHGSLLTCGSQYIAHQCNCVSQKSSGLAAQIFKAFPYADTYTGRTTHHVPGTIQVMTNGVGSQAVINMYAQNFPGKPSQLEDTLTRLEWFYSCLQEIALIPDLTEVAFPYMIGCGLAGGSWPMYYNTIKSWSESLPARVLIVNCGH